MTDQNNAALRHAEDCHAATDAYFAAHSSIDTMDNRRIYSAGFDDAYTLLSKLRAEGVQAGDEREAFEAWAAAEVPAHKLGRAPWPHEDLYNWVSMEYAWSMWQKIRAALASAPVAGDAQPSDADITMTIRALNAQSSRTRHADGEMGVRVTDVMIARAVLARYGHTPLPVTEAVLQASEVVRPDPDAIGLARAGMELHSPGMPEHTICAELVRLADALKSQPQAEKDGAVCSCPTGDGSLRWPCPVHPPRSQDSTRGAADGVDPCGYAAVRALAVDWLKKQYPELTNKGRSV